MERDGNLVADKHIGRYQNGGEKGTILPATTLLVWVDTPERESV